MFCVTNQEMNKRDKTYKQQLVANADSVEKGEGGNMDAKS